MHLDPATDILSFPDLRAAAWRMTVDQYQQLSASGLVPQNTELIRGVVIDQMTVTPEHSWLVRFLAKKLRGVLGDGFEVRQEQPMTLKDSEPEPDIAVVRDDGSGHRRRHPSTAELVVEVCLTSEALDRQKVSIYAEAGVAECWLVVEKRSEVEVYLNPANGAYGSKLVLGREEILKSSQLPGVEIDLAELFAESS